MNSLIIGSRSQLSYYFPKEYERISSENIRLNLPIPLKDDNYDRVYITITEQRLHEIKDFETYIDVNYTKTLKLIEFFQPKANAIIVYGSCELWNKYIGEISIDDKFNYDLSSPYTGYCVSKHMLVNKIHDSKMKNVFILHPFNFNSTHRKPGFLFYKVFDSIINKKKIEIGDTYFYRDLIHPKYVVERSLVALEDEIVGSGHLTHINDFIRKLYTVCGLKYEDYVTENIQNIITTTKKKDILYLKTKEFKYNTLLEDTLNDIRIEIQNKIS